MLKPSHANITSPVKRTKLKNQRKNYVYRIEWTINIHWKPIVHLVDDLGIFSSFFAASKEDFTSLAFRFSLKTILSRLLAYFNRFCINGNMESFLPKWPRLSWAAEETSWPREVCFKLEDSSPPPFCSRVCSSRTTNLSTKGKYSIRHAIFLCFLKHPH